MLKETSKKKTKYSLSPSGEFVIENYNFAKPHANFLAGIAGKYGIPMWVFYVNRGQAICSFGTKDKDHAILEFFPANKAWQLVTTLGFRTFIKISHKKSTTFYEPFRNGFANMRFNLKNSMHISAHGLRLVEENSTLGLKLSVDYFNIPNASYAGLVRKVTIENLDKQGKRLDLLDGLPQIVPFGTSNLFLKKLGRTIEAWMEVKNLDKHVPFYKLDVDPTDRPEVIHINEGNFYLSFYHKDKKPKIIKPIVDPVFIFGPITDFSFPTVFMSNSSQSASRSLPPKSKMPCAFSYLKLKLSGYEKKEFYSVIGTAKNQETLNSSIKKITKYGYLSSKSRENKEIIEGLQKDIHTESSCKEFNLYAKQTYLDNTLRGGYPVIYKTSSNKAVFYLYSRKHGDLERDYNKFQLQPTYLSQGNGNYRDMNQNRRSNIWFNPLIEEEDLVFFLNLLQTDGFNPLVIKGTFFVYKNGADLGSLLEDITDKQGIIKIKSFIEKPFAPGSLIMFTEENKIQLNASLDDFLSLILSCCTQIHEAEHGEGFWTDHWTYNLDLLENYLAIYPENLSKIVFDERVFSFYDNSEIVKPTSDKYVLRDGQIKQFHAVASDSAKKEIIRKRQKNPHIVRTEYGHGEIYKTTLINKLLCLLANKFASLDPSGMGIEMEADKPNWFDSLNGLPALLGSSLCETFELKRLAIFIKSALRATKINSLGVSEEIYEFLLGLNKITKEHLNSKAADKNASFWKDSHTLKEKYRSHSKLGLSGKEVTMQTAELEPILDNALEKLQLGIEKARDQKKCLYYSYFINEVANYEIKKDPFVIAKSFVQKQLPLFLEGQMHAIRLAKDTNEAKQLHEATKSSSLYDKNLKMYKVTASLSKMPEEIGRCRVFAPGWLENESIWLHMEYKYLLELLKKGLYNEFYQDFKNVLVPFQDPSRYGRSILENSSFIVSSAFPDKSLHGNGFVARLSGSTAEFLNIWLIMNLGNKPFFLDEQGQLNLSFRPALAGWLFSKNGEYSFNFLSKIRVVYHNSKRKDTFGKNCATVKRIVFEDKNGTSVELKSNKIPPPYSQQIRSLQVNRIDVYLE